VFLGEELAKGKDYSDQTAREVDEEIQRITANAFQHAIDTLKENRDAFDQLAELLIEHEEVPGSEVLKLVNGEAEALEEVAATNGTATDEEDTPPEDPSGDAEMVEETGDSTADGQSKTDDHPAEDR
jgi:cell division protease FtsH